MRKRTKAREIALQVLYQLDLRGEEIRDDAERQLAETDPDPETPAFAQALVHGTWEHRAEIDAAIEAVARNWEMRRMAAIDRNILRLGTFELLYRDDIPPLVTINEA